MSASFSFEGRRVFFENSDTIASALLRRGVLLFSRSAKFHRPRGPFCLAGDCAQCHMRVGGVPSLPTCITPAREGLEVSRQHALGSPRFDLLRSSDYVFRRGLDHHRLLTPSRLLNRVMRSAVRKMAGIGTLPSVVREPVPAEEAEADLIVIGGGRSGRVVARTARRLGKRVILLERNEGRRALALHAESGERWVLASTPERLLQIRTRHVVLATGGHERNELFEGNDLPGIFGARGLLRLARNTGVRPGTRVVVAGEEASSIPLSEVGYDPVLLPPGWRVLRASGHRRVRRVLVQSQAGERQVIACELLAIAAPLEPAWELGGQVGARTRRTREGFVLEVDTDGRTTTPWLFACGKVSGHAVEAERVAENAAR